MALYRKPIARHANKTGIVPTMTINKRATHRHLLRIALLIAMYKRVVMAYGSRQTYPFLAKLLQQALTRAAEAIRPQTHKIAIFNLTGIPKPTAHDIRQTALLLLLRAPLPLTRPLLHNAVVLPPRPTHPPATVRVRLKT